MTTPRPPRQPRLAALALLAAGAASCGKVPIHDVYAEFLLADASWFAEEDTLFIFYDVTAEQGLGDPSVIEITYATDDERINWTPVSDFTTVHPHLPVDCGTTSLCGSTSLHVAGEPREVGVRLRYHRDGELALEADTVFNVVGPGDPDSNRSFVVYGVFDETNQRVQWRGRHQLPTLRNKQAQDLGLRRWFQVEDQVTGTEALTSSSDPYGYGARCPSDFEATDLEVVETVERAVWNDADLPLTASTHAAVCAQSTVLDANGTYTTGAVARKNPEVRPAFPVLRSPIHDATPVRFFLAPCERTISAEHEAMQRQRLQMEDVETTCIDDWDDAGFVDHLIVAFTDAIEAERDSGEDMVLVIGLHQDDDDVATVVEEALAAIVPDERHRSSPRLAGAFVFDSDIRGLEDDTLAPSTLWCPASILALETGDFPDASTRTCAIAPDNPSIDLGPFSFGTLPILPPRDQYLDFIDTWSDAQAGEVLSLSYRTPEFSVTSAHADIGEYGVATFFDDEQISVGDDDAFSYCVGDDPYIFVFRSEIMQSDAFIDAITEQCATEEIDETLCAVATQGLLPLDFLGEWHALFGEENYDLGLFWDFPFLLHMEYEAVAAGNVSAFGFSVPFGLAADGESYLGTEMWTTDEFPLDELLTQCTRFCDHPTFDSAGVYHVTDNFDETYPSACYLPRYPELDDSGFPRDP